jgi:hypothetical protein
MANDTSPEPVQLPGNIGKLILDPLEHSIAAGAREALKVGVPTHNVVEMFLNHLASVVAMIEPAGARAATVEGLVNSFGTMVHKHVEAQRTTKSGLLVPRPELVNG